MNAAATVNTPVPQYLAEHPMSAEFSGNSNIPVSTSIGKTNAQAEPAVVGTAVPLEFDSGVSNAESMQQATVPTLEVPTGFRGVISSIKEKTVRLLETQKPWSEMIDRTSFSKPENMTEATSRIQKNLSHYRTNYLVFGIAITALAFMTNPSSLLWSGLLAIMWVYMYLIRTTPLVINGREISDRERMLGMSAISFIVIFFLTNVAAVFLYGASIGAVMIAAHAAFREPDQLFVDEGAGQNSDIFGSIPFLSNSQGFSSQASSGTNIV